LEAYVYDAGFVYAPQRSFVLTVFSEGIPEPKAVDLIAELAAIIYPYWIQHQVIGKRRPRTR
jgi:hypothetical protein